MKLHMSELPEPHSTNFTLVGLLPCVDPQVSQVVCVDPKGFAAVLAFMWFLSRVLQFVGLESLTDDEPLPTHITTKRTFS